MNFNIDAKTAFPSTVDSVLKIIEQFNCPLCKKTLNQPVTLWNCDHVFCKLCLDPSLSNCPVCNIPYWESDKREDKCMQDTIIALQSLVKHLNIYAKVDGEHNEGQNVSAHDDDVYSFSSDLPPEIPAKSNFLTMSTNTSQNNSILKPSLASCSSKNVISQEKNKALHTPSSKKKSASNHAVNKVQATPKSSSATPKGKRKSKTSVDEKENVLITPIRKQKRNSLVKGTPKSESKLTLKGESKLHVAAIKNDVASVKELLADCLIEINGKDFAGWTALHEACSRGHNEIVTLLIKSGASVNVPGYENQTPLMDAVMGGRIETARILLKAGADPSLPGENGMTAYMLAKSDEMKALLNENAGSSAHDSIKDQLNKINTRPLPSISLAFSSAVGLNDVSICSDILDADVLMSEAVKAIPTHLVVKSYGNNTTDRTLKYLQAMACGAWIVTPEWLHACINGGSWVKEAPFIIDGTVEDFKPSAPMRSIIRKLNGLPGIFNGCHFYIYGGMSKSSPTKPQLSRMLECADGVILSREPKPDSDSVQGCNKTPYHCPNNLDQYRFTYYIVYDPEHAKPSRIVKRGKVCSVPVEWVMNCISSFAFCPLE